MHDSDADGSACQLTSATLFAMLFTFDPEYSLRADIHDRMPGILPDGAYDLWLDPGFQKPDGVCDLLNSFNPVLMRRYEVSSRVNLVKNNDAALRGACGAGNCGWRMSIATFTVACRIRKNRTRRISATAVPANIRKSDDLLEVLWRSLLLRLPSGRSSGKPLWKQNGSSGMGLPQIGLWEITLQMVAAQDARACGRRTGPEDLHLCDSPH
jgi:hypothetical protein